jgi:hypothetical protein
MACSDAPWERLGELQAAYDRARADAQETAHDVEALCRADAER